MRVVYRGHEINVNRERALGGWMNTYYSVFRLSDQYECTSGYDGDDSVRDTVKYLKGIVDQELAKDDPWDEKADHEPFTD